MLEQLDNRTRRVVRVPAEMHAPYKGRVYDPCCASAAIFVRRSVESVYGPGLVHCRDTGYVYEADC